MTEPTTRRAVIEANIAAVRRRIAAAAEQAGRDPDTVQLIAVTKFFPASDAVLLAECGVTDLGESRDQEAAAKVAEVHATVAPGSVRWHFIGRLQTNKARSVARYADVVHGLDRPALVGALADGAKKAGRELDVLIQVSLDGDTDRGGIRAVDALDLADEAAAADGLRVRGVMAVAPMGMDVDDAFAMLAEVSASVRVRYPEADVISAGMSGDLEAAIRHGATHVRIGTALLGRRPPTFG